VTTAPLFFVDHLPREPRLRLDGPEGRHAARVRRVTVGEAVLVADGLGAVADCVVAEVSADAVELDVRDWRTLPLPDPLLVVVQALPKGERGELAVDLCTELGVDEIVPWAAERCVVQWRDGRAHKGVEKWRRTAREAAKQSRRPRVPMVTDLASATDVAERIGGAATALVLHEDATERLSSVDLPAAGEIVVIVGPEGGVSGAELDAFTAAGATSVRLGEPVLRTSTAGAAALAALSLRVGRWG
jgi:16S rRNA (uracil1498-N3)-methyltransferase